MTDSLYRTETRLRRMVRVHYPEGRGRMVLRTSLDWDQDVPPDAVTGDGATSTFTVEAKRPYVYFKPVLKRSGEERWAVGSNSLLSLTASDPADAFPHFDGAETGSYSPVIERDSTILGRKHQARVYLPPGYNENTLRRYPVFYMQDGKNLFFPDEAFLGNDWGVGEAVRLLDTMNAVDRVVIVGIHSGDRMNEYTQPGYEAYARSVVEEIKPEIDQRIRVHQAPSETGVIGSSLGGVVSFYMAWEYPEVFGYAACISSTFSHKDDLIDRVLAEPKHASRFYLDSGWPGDNYEVTLAMAMALGRRGYKVRQDFIHFVFPLEEHDEGAWGRRLHLPIQLSLGTATTTQRRKRASA